MATGAESSNDRDWMYSGWKRGKPTDEWYENTKEFLDFAFSDQANIVQNGKIKCPCADCRNYIMKDRDAVELDLCGFGFKRNYSVWTEHGEGRVHLTDHVVDDVDEIDRMDDMLNDLAASNPPLEESESAADQFKQQFWSIYKLVNDTPEQRLVADKVLENLARKQLRQMMYQARKDAVKKYFNEISDEPLDKPLTDSQACHRQLEKSQYIQGRLEWCKDAEAWDSLCEYWCSDEFFRKSRTGKLSRKKASPEEIAQNKGGSRNFIRTKNFIRKTFGPEQATSMNTYKYMKVGDKKYRESGSSVSVDNLKSKNRIDAYMTGLKAAYPDDWEDRDFDPGVLYSTGGGMPHGRLAIGDSAFKKSEVVVATKRTNVKPSNSMSYQALLKRNQYLENRHAKDRGYFKVLFANAGLDVPEDLEDDSMEDSDHVNQSSPSVENGGTPLTSSSRAGDQPSGQHDVDRRAREDSPIIDG